ncbi:MAG: hypothetical protein FJY56_08580 [Betaproteobacteria bacterium]|nr:hypothetical protein [Betaproteobacteria bacterium]
MTIHDQRILRFAPRQADALARQLVSDGARAIAAAGGRLFGVFKPVIGMSQNCVIVISEWPDEAAAKAHAAAALQGVHGAELAAQDLWEPTARPLPGEAPTETSGFYSHRAFDIRPQNWPRFLELSESAWGNFEGVNDSVVKGFWKARTPPEPGLLRVRLMAWYASLDAWERSRWWSSNARAGQDEAIARFRERSAMLENNEVAILTRVVA